MNHASLFSGIGMFDLAAEAVGWNNIFCCENDKRCNVILNKHFPESIKYKDVRTTDFNIHRGTVDVLSAGFPCQPFSNAGEQQGESDERFLWFEVLRAAREIEPRWIVAENVGGILSAKFASTFERICNSLEAEGYEVQPFDIHSACYGLPTVERHVWIVAKNNKIRHKGFKFNTLQGGG